MAGVVAPTSARDSDFARPLPELAQRRRHAVWVRATHWLTVVCFVALLYTGIEIIISHPRFYWGETGNVNMKPLFSFPIPSSRDTVPTGYGYVMPDQNGWSRALHFESAWVLVFTTLIYGVAAFWTGHFRRDIFPQSGTFNWRACCARIGRYLRRAPADPAEVRSYNVLQRTAYVVVIFVLFPMVIWTGLALSPAFDSAFPFAVNVLGGRQSARTLHFLVSVAIVLFLVVHVVMVALSGFWARMRAMTTGGPALPEEQP
jgi:thiosulfate reductase cytochrome b subunit